MKSYKKYLLILIPLICFIGCSKSNGTEIKATIASMPSANRVVCNEFGVAYYEFKTSHNHFVYSPVYRHYPAGGVYVLSCDDYNDYVNSLTKGNSNEEMSR